MEPQLWCVRQGTAQGRGESMDEPPPPLSLVYTHRLKLRHAPPHCQLRLLPLPELQHQHLQRGAANPRSGGCDGATTRKNVFCCGRPRHTQLYVYRARRFWVVMTLCCCVVVLFRVRIRVVPTSSRASRITASIQFRALITKAAAASVATHCAVSFVVVTCAASPCCS